MNLKLSEINQYDNLGLIAKQLVDGFITGLHKSPYHGFSVEFAEHKLYNALMRNYPPEYDISNWFLLRTALCTIGQFVQILSSLYQDNKLYAH